MTVARFRGEEAFGLIAALVAHAGLVALLVLRMAEPPVPPPERMNVTLSDTLGLKDSAPQPAKAASTDLAPTLGEAQPAAPVPEPKPAPKPASTARPQPKPAPVPKLAPAPKSSPGPAPKPTASARPVDPIAAAIANANAQKGGKGVTQARTDAVHKSKAPEGGSRIGADFLKGTTSANAAGKSRAAPAETAGPAVMSALSGVIARQLKPHWNAPQGADAEQLVTVLSFDLNSDGTLAGAPKVVRQMGIDDSNRPQAPRHAEQAIRAVELAEPFPLPSEYYDSWKHLTVRFDRNLSR